MQDFVDPAAQPPIATSSSETPEDAFIQEMAAFLDMLARKTGIRMANQLIRLFHNTHFNLSLFREKIRTVSECRRLATEKCRHMFRNSGFQETHIDTTWSDGTKGRTALYLRDSVDVLREQFIALDRSDSFAFRPTQKGKRSDGSLIQTELMQSEFFHTVYNSIRQRVFSSRNEKVVWKDTDRALPRSFVGFLQVFSDKTASTLSSSAFVAYPIHVVFLNTSPSKREWLINNGYSIIGFLPVSISEYNADGIEDDCASCIPQEPQVELALDDEVRLTSTSDGREQNMLVLHNALTRALESLESINDMGFQVKTKDSAVWNCFPTLV